MMYAVHKQQARFISSSIPCHLWVLFDDDDGLLERQRLIQLVAAGDKRSSRPSYMRRSRFSVNVPWFTTTQLFRVVFKLSSFISDKRTSSCTANQFQLSWVAHLTWPTATIHGNKRNTYVSCPCAPYEGTRASRGIDPLTNLGTIWRWLVKLHPPASLRLGKEPCVATTGWAGRRVGLEKGKNSWICRESKHNYS